MKKDEKKVKKAEKKGKKKSPRIFKNVRKEMKKVRWPKRAEMVKYSLAVLICIVILSLFFTLSDLIIAFVRTVLEGL